MAGPFYNNIKGTSSGAAGTGAFTPLAASSGALAWSTVPAGWMGLVRYEDGSSWELQYSYWNGTTLSRSATAQFVSSSSGSGLTLTSAATAEMVGDANEIAPHLVTPTYLWAPQPGSGNMGSQFASISLSNSGTAAATAIATTNSLTEQLRTQTTSATTANAQAGVSTTAGLVIISTTAGRGGFEYSTRFGASQIPTGNRMFVGMTATTMVGVTTEPSALTANYAAFAKDSTDTNIQLLVNSNAGGGTKTDTGIALVANGWYEASIWCEPGSNTVKALLFRLDTGAIFYATTSTDVPANGSVLFPQMLMGLSATTGTAVISHFGTTALRLGAG